MTDQPPPSLQEQLADPVVRDRDTAFAAPLQMKRLRERRRSMLTSLLWRAGVVATAGVIAIGVGVGAVYLFRLAVAALAAG